MYGPLFSVLLLGMIPVWGVNGSEHSASRDMHIAPPETAAISQHLQSELGDQLSASGAIVVDLQSGQVLFEHEARVARPMASLTKLMTALLIVERHDLDEWATIPATIEDVDGTVAYLPAGSRFRVGDLLTALLTQSANDAGVTLAIHHSGSVEEFVDEMNARARMLGLRSTSFQNPIGLDAPLHRSSPQDIAWLTMYVLRYGEIAERMGRKSAQIQSNSGETISLTHTHTLLHVDGLITAGKTGTTDGAKQCLLSIVESNGRTYGVVLLHSGDRYGDMRTVIDALVQ